MIKKLISSSIFNIKNPMMIVIKNQYNFSTDQKNKMINELIIKIKQSKQLIPILSQHSEYFNTINIATCLNVMAHKFSRNDEMLNNLLFPRLVQIVKSKWYLFQQINSQNIRSLTMVVNQFSLIKNTSLNKQFASLNREQLFKICGDYQFSLLITGFTRLKVYDQSTISNIVYQRMQRFLQIKYVINIWRTLLQNDINTPKMNIFLSSLLKNKVLTGDFIKDYVYLIYCVAKTQHQIDLQNLKLMLIKYPKLHKNIPKFQLSILLKYIGSIQMLRDQIQLFFIIKNSYLRIVQENYRKNLRILANNFHYLKQLNKIDSQILDKTYYSFLLAMKQNIPKQAHFIDPNSINSLFTDLFQLTKQNNLSKAYQLGIETISFLEKYPLNLFKPKQFFILINSLYNFKSEFKNFEISKKIKEKLAHEIASRNIIQQQVKQQILFSFAVTLQLRNPQLCKKYKQYGNVNFSQSKCIMSKNGTNCLKCL